MIVQRKRAKKTARPEEMLRWAIGASSLGLVLVASSAKGVAAILIDQEPEQLTGKLQRKFPAAHLIDDRHGQKAVLARIIKFVDHPARGLDVELDLRGSAFQQKVWRAICAIPPGQSATYSDIAHKIGAPRAARAVGTVCAHNTLAIAVPCHRVLHKDGSPLAGYHWGGHKQLALIARETLPHRTARKKRPVAAAKAGALARLKGKLNDP